MAEPASLPPLRDVIARFGLRADKRLGQNFLLDLNLTARIARAAGPLAGHVVLEIGPGPGGLTRALLDAGAERVIAVERDARCVVALGELANAYSGRLRVVEGDALQIDEAELVGREPARIVANLPYNIATVLLLKWLGDVRRFRSYTLMFQKEVAERLVAAPGTKAYGRLSVMTQWRCEARRLFDVPARAFTPSPKVTSSVVGLIPRETPLAPADAGTLERVVAAAFGQRRKMLRSALRTLGDDAEARLFAAGIAPTSRAEELDVAAFCALARAYEG
ncbi:MAG TPA: 16S rRNA (adenine(1518)-N(6)/adenine(1519)-N(6))-dimethyltransferase RsmA [Candidatus Cybelea sp.]|nr:16S rRNA (adenine(1518)-N(6)/adenine(1519)-N(6))-dimethyltransferase RsmA [Candidatus Cybelea sp.]